MKTIFKLSPLLVIYTLYIFAFNRVEIGGDEIRYLEYANNLSKGYYADSQNPHLASGPGYPLFLTVFVLLKIPLFVAKLANGIFVFAGLVFFYKLSNQFVSDKTSLYSTYALGMYFPMFDWLRFLITEPFTFSLINLFLFASYKFLHLKKFDLRFIGLSAIVLGLLILTKFIFAYISFICFLVVLLFYFINKNRKILRFSVLLLWGFIISTPYLIYTYSLTGKYFYYSTASGLGLYWMSTKYENEYGSILSYTNHELYNTPEINPSHKQLFNSFKESTYFERNEILTTQAKKNIIENPFHYLNNLASNISRFIFNFPFSHENQKLNRYFIFNFGLTLVAICSLIPAWFRRKTIPIELILFSLFFIVYFGISCSITTFARLFFPLVPILVLWITFFLTSIVRIQIVKEET